MTSEFLPTGLNYGLSVTDSLDGFNFEPGDYPNSVQITNTDTANAVVAWVQPDLGATYYAAAPTNIAAGRGIVIPPSTTITQAVNTQFSSNAQIQMAGTAVCVTVGETARIIFTSGAQE